MDVFALFLMFYDGQLQKNSAGGEGILKMRLYSIFRTNDRAQNTARVVVNLGLLNYLCLMLGKPLRACPDISYLLMSSEKNKKVF